MSRHIFSYLILFFSINSFGSNICSSFFFDSETSVKTLVTRHQVRVLNDILKSENSITTVAIAREIGISPAAISHLKTGITLFSVHRAIEVSRVLKISIWDLIGFVSEFKTLDSHPFLKIRLRNNHPTYNPNLNKENLNQELLKAQVEHLKLLRRLYGKHLVQKDFADALGLSASAISHIFTGRTFLSLVDAIVFARLLRVDPKMVLMFAEGFDGLNLKTQNSRSSSQNQITYKIESNLNSHVSEQVEIIPVSKEDLKVKSKQPEFSLDKVNSFVSNFEQGFSIHGFFQLTSLEQAQVVRQIQGWNRGKDSSKAILYVQMPEVMFLALKEGNLEKLDFYSRIFPLEYEFQNQSYMTILLAAIEVNNLAAIELLLNRGANIDYKNFEGYNPLTFAIHQNRPEAFRILLAQKLKVKSPLDGIILEDAISFQRLSMIEDIIQIGFPFDIPGGLYKRSAFNYAAGSWPNIDVLRLLMRYQPDINQVNEKGNTPIMNVVDAPYMAYENSRSFEVFEFLIRNGADVSVKNKHGKTVMDMINSRLKSQYPSARENAIKMKNLLLNESIIRE